MGHSALPAEVISQNVEILAVPDNSHNPVEEFWWVIHGHHYGKIDHDHNLGMLLRSGEGNNVPFQHLSWPPFTISAISALLEPLERPPRV